MPWAEQGVRGLQRVMPAQGLFSTASHRKEPDLLALQSGPSLAVVAHVPGLPVLRPHLPRSLPAEFVHIESWVRISSAHLSGGLFLAGCAPLSAKHRLGHLWACCLDSMLPCP